MMAINDTVKYELTQSLLPPTVLLMKLYLCADKMASIFSLNQYYMCLRCASICIIYIKLTFLKTRTKRDPRFKVSCMLFLLHLIDVLVTAFS